MANETNELQDWQKKILGRKDRWNVLYNSMNGAMQGGAAGAIGSIKDEIPGLAKDAVRNATAFQRPVQVMGKTFAPGIRTNWVRRGLKWTAGGLTSVAASYGTGKVDKAIKNAHPADQVYQMSTGDLYWQLSVYGVYPDETCIAELASKTGYKFDGAAFHDKLDRAVAEAGDLFYDNTWRNEIMPHIIKSLFKEELAKMHVEIAKQAREKGVTSTELLDDTLATGTNLMKDILEDYTTRLANTTELLGSPIRFKKSSPDHTAQPPANMTKDEKRRWDTYVSESKDSTYLTTDYELRMMRAEAMKRYPLKTTAEVAQDFQTRMSSQKEGAAADINSAEAASAILEIREIKNRYKKRGWFNRNLFHRAAARQEREAIDQMTARLKEKYPAEEVDRRINDENYLAGKGGGVSAKNIYGLADVSPRSTRAQYAADVTLTVASRGLAIAGNAIATAVTVGTYGYTVGKGLVTGAIGGVKNVINRWRNGGEQPQENNAPENAGKNDKEDVKKDVKENAKEDIKEDVKENAGVKAQEKQPEKAKEKEPEPEVNDDFKIDFDDDDFMGGFGNDEPEKEGDAREEVKNDVANDRNPEIGKEGDAREDDKNESGFNEAPDIDEDGDVYEDAQEAIVNNKNPEEEEQWQEALEELPEEPDNEDHKAAGDQEQPVDQEQQGWGSWLWGAAKGTVNYVGSFFGGNQVEAPKQEVPAEPVNIGEEPRRQEEKKDGDVREINFDEFKNKVAPDQQKHDIVRKAPEENRVQERVNDQVMDNNKAMVPGGPQ
ncbi:MAG: hypothetical protein K6C95_03100 [Lachnospiraceae bacterium]|nr:hypothetical protein [Lachnospiraceae bacterium]